MGEPVKLPETKDELLVAALRHADDVGKLLNDLSDEVFRLEDAKASSKFDGLHKLLLTRFNTHSSLGLFIAADNIGVELPDDLKPEGPAYD